MKTILRPQFSILAALLAATAQLSTLNPQRASAQSPTADNFNPGVDGTVSSLAVQADGKILVGGWFTTLGGQSRDHLGRLNNTEPATQNLSYDGSTITWLRGGTSPEVWRTSIALSTNGSDWTTLGAGTRIPGGWQLTGVTLPAGGTIRARGHVTGGKFEAPPLPGPLLHSVEEREFGGGVKMRPTAAAPANVS